ncbi:MAG TPA: FAD/NAD(P)-binding protein [bacterium]|nr:FAD/NAD(P)-binding protein [bacterium]
MAADKSCTKEMPDMFLPMMSEISKIESYTEKEKLFEIKLPGGKDLGHQPGQFVEVSLFGIGEAPISISSSPTKKGAFDMCVRSVGSVTNALHAMNVGDKIGIRGPFGKGFDLDELKGKDILFIGGGIGIVPLRSLINYTLDKPKDFGRLIILYGAKSPTELLFPEEVKRWGSDKNAEFHVTVDSGGEGWKGNTGVITTLIPPLKLDISKTVAVVVGPPIMYKFVIMSLHSKGFKDEQIVVSLERRMKCGLGKCGHCQMNHIYVCQDGPVFNYAKIREVEEAIR